MDDEIDNVIERYKKRFGRLNLTTFAMNFEDKFFRAKFINGLEQAIESGKPLSDKDFNIPSDNPDIKI